jgi:hypothetical protein
MYAGPAFLYQSSDEESQVPATGHVHSSERANGFGGMGTGQYCIIVASEQQE